MLKTVLALYIIKAKSVKINKKQIEGVSLVVENQPKRNVPNG